MALALAPALPELVRVPCPECDGAGFHEWVTPLGVDHSERCTGCYGAKFIERCSGCHLEPTIVDGVDSCGCAAPVLIARVA